MMWGVFFFFLFFVFLSSEVGELIQGDKPKNALILLRKDYYQLLTSCSLR